MFSLNESQLKTLSEISADIGQVLFASVVVPFLFDSTNINMNLWLSGLVLTFVAWLSSVILTKGATND